MGLCARVFLFLVMWNCVLILQEFVSQNFRDRFVCVCYSCSSVLYNMLLDLIRKNRLMFCIFAIASCKLSIYLACLQVDPYVGISNDFQVFVKPLANVGEYGSPNDNQEASLLMSDLRKNIFESENIMLDILSQSLSKITKVWTVLINELIFK